MGSSTPFMASPRKSHHTLCMTCYRSSPQVLEMSRATCLSHTTSSMASPAPWTHSQASHRSPHRSLLPPDPAWLILCLIHVFAHGSPFQEDPPIALLTFSRAVKLTYLLYLPSVPPHENVGPLRPRISVVLCSRASRSLRRCHLLMRPR